jgi:signal transduction histidine kinase
METCDLTTILLIGESVFYIFTAGLALTRRGLREEIARSLVLYAVASFLSTLGLAFRRPVPLDFLGITLPFHLPFYNALILSLLFLYLSRSFLRLEGPGLGWWALGTAWMVAPVILDSDLVSLPSVLWIGGRWGIQRQGGILGLMVTGWGILTGGALLLTVIAFRRVQQPLHRNRIRYWPIVWAFIFAGGILLFGGHQSLGSGFQLLGTLIATYVVLTHRLPDVAQFVRRTASYFIITLLTIILYTTGFLATEYVFQTVPGYSPLLAGAVTALILAVFFHPLLRLIQRLVNQLISGSGYDASHALREYSQSISNILDMERLATVAVGVISEAMEIRHGALFLVHRGQEEEEEQESSLFHLTAVQGMGELPPSGILSGDNPVAHYLCHEHRPLTQYDIDLLPRFREMSSAERNWLMRLGMDVYVPIYAMGEWIGLLALGPKLSGDRYFDDDLVLLSTLADQTAVALENARLVRDLRQLSSDLYHAYADLDKANQQLQEMDKLKSAFIGVVTHELRSPFANIVFSLQLFERYGVDHMPAEQREQLEQLASTVDTAKTMVDNLVTFASFLSKQGELHPTDFDLCEMIPDVCSPLQAMVEAKDLSLQVTLPEALPPLNGDRERLANAVHHLVHNAIKFTEVGGEIDVRGWFTEGAVCLEVKDTGVGVPADKLPALWDGFTQMADPLRRGMEGLGLGLALVKYIVTAHGGSVWAQSEEGVGSTFGFQIPLNDSTCPAESSPAEQIR